MSGVQITDKVYWIGKVDDREVPFHRLILKKGTTYNSYLLKTEKPTIVDTVDIIYGREYLENVSKIVNPADIQFIVINHVEPDHAGALPALAAKAPNAKIVCTEEAVSLLKDMFKLHQREFITVKDGDTLDIGGKTLRFLKTPFLHTEETMMTYEPEDGILFSCDVFSTHIASHEVFNDLAKINYIEKFNGYYTTIMAPHRPYIRKMLEKIKDLKVNVIGPSHGYILRDNAQKFISMYDEMSNIGEMGKEKKVVIIYSTMTGNTTKIADRIAKGMEDLGITPQVFNMKNADKDEVKNSIHECDGLLAGSSTKYADTVGEVEAFLKSLEGETFKGKFAAAFGSYGWSGEAVIHVEEQLEQLGFDIINQRYLIKVLGIDTPLFPLRIRFLREEELDRAEDSGRVFAEQVLTH
ncbi:MAG: FprA family A-type flavoprotein [Clostridia bacterium]|nr:FprA family A-type flavoprotein [Clostridia bacterium]